MAKEANELTYKYLSRVDYSVPVGPYLLAPKGMLVIKEDLKVNPAEVFKKVLK